MRTKSEIRTRETQKKAGERSPKDEGRSDSFEGGPAGNNSPPGRQSRFGFRNSFGSRFSAFGFQTYASTVPTILAALILVCSCRVSGAEPSVLVYQKNGKGFVHDNLTASAAAIQELGKQNGFGVDVSTNPAVFADETLKKYRALIFANSNNEAFEKDAQREAFQRFIRGGGGFMGIHSSTGSERHWQYYSDPVFRRHILGGIRWVLGEKTTPQTPLVP
jgi:hypothetical protein